MRTSAISFISLNEIPAAGNIKDHLYVAVKIQDRALTFQKRLIPSYVAVNIQDPALTLQKRLTDGCYLESHPSRHTTLFQSCVPGGMK